MKALVAILFACAIAAPRFATAAECTGNLEKEAENVSLVFQNWHDLYDGYKKYVVCDDGAIAEGFSDQVVKLLTKHWNLTHDLELLVDGDSNFENFLTRHIDETMSPNEREQIIELADRECMPENKHVCSLLEKRARDLKAESEKNNLER